MAQHNSKRPTTAGASTGSKKNAHVSVAFTTTLVPRAPSAKTGVKRGSAAPAETIEARLDRKATIADGRTFSTKSLGQMSREQRHKLLYGD
jgi:hypothetical protein